MKNLEKQYSQALNRNHNLSMQMPRLSLSVLDRKSITKQAPKIL